VNRILIFDWTSGGHHELYVELFVRAVRESLTPIVAGPTSLTKKFEANGVEAFDLGPPRPRLDASRRMQRAVVQLARREVELFREAIVASRCTYAVHLFADGIMRQLLTTRRLPAKTAVLLFRPRFHYPSLYSTPQTTKERVLGLGYEGAVWGWRQRPDAHAVLTLDEGAANRWARQRGARSVWIPEPPVLTDPSVDGSREGVGLFGSLGPRKGIDRLARAAQIDGTDLSLTIAGNVVPGYEGTLMRLAFEIRSADVDLNVRARLHGEHEVTELFQRMRCVVLPYVNHIGMSRVLLEATRCGTPVVVQNHGLIGFLVREYGIGIAVDTDHPEEFRGAMRKLCHDDACWRKHHQAALEFAERYTMVSFQASLRDAFLTG
jgi:glycosyltransferase involved in cell wall biosynthesis